MSLVNKVNEAFGVSIDESFNPDLTELLKKWNVTDFEENSMGLVINQDVTVPYWKPNLPLPKGISAIKGKLILKNTQISDLSNIPNFVFGDLDLSGCVNITDKSFEKVNKEFGGIDGNIIIKGTSVNNAKSVIDAFDPSGDVVHDKNIMFDVTGKLTKPVKNIEKAYDESEAFKKAFNDEINKIGQKVKWSGDIAAWVGLTLLKGVDAKFAESFGDAFELEHDWFKNKTLTKTQLKKYIGVKFPAMFEHNLENVMRVFFEIMQDVNFSSEFNKQLKDVQKNPKFYNAPSGVKNLVY